MRAIQRSYQCAVLRYYNLRDIRPAELSTGIAFVLPFLSQLAALAYLSKRTASQGTLSLAH